MTSPPEIDTVAADLLAFARNHSGRADLVFATAPERLVAGEATASYGFAIAGGAPPFDGPLVLRLFAGEGDARAAAAARARFEAAAHEALGALEYPVPPVRVTGDDALIARSHFTVVERPAGETLWARMRPPSRHAFGAGAILADAHARLHALDASPFVAAVTALGAADRLDPLRMLTLTDADLDARGATPLRATWEWLRAHQPAAGDRAICHAQLEPQRLIVDGTRLVGVLDWGDVQIADPHFDVAQTVVLLHFARIDAPAPIARAVDAMRRALQVQYRRAYARQRPVDEERLAYFEAFAIGQRLLQGAVGARVGLRSGWAHPDVRRRLASRLRGLTGLTIEDAGAAGSDGGDGVVWA